MEGVPLPALALRLNLWMLMDLLPLSLPEPRNPQNVAYEWGVGGGADKHLRLVAALPMSSGFRLQLLLQEASLVDWHWKPMSLHALQVAHGLSHRQSHLAAEAPFLQ